MENKNNSTMDESGSAETAVVCEMAKTGIRTLVSGEVSPEIAANITAAGKNYARRVRTRRLIRQIAGLATTAACFVVVFSMSVYKFRSNAASADFETCCALAALATVVTDYDDVLEDEILMYGDLMFAYDDRTRDFNSFANDLLLMQESAVFIADLAASEDY